MLSLAWTTSALWIHSRWHSQDELRTASHNNQNECLWCASRSSLLLFKPSHSQIQWGWVCVGWREEKKSPLCSVKLYFFQSHFHCCISALNALLNFLTKSNLWATHKRFFWHVGYFHSETVIAHFSLFTFFSCAVCYCLMLVSSLCLSFDNHIVEEDHQSIWGNHKGCWDVRLTQLSFVSSPLRYARCYCHLI